MSTLATNDEMVVHLGGAELELDLTEVGTTQIYDRKWYFSAATFKKINELQSEIRGYFGRTMFAPEVVNTYYDDHENGVGGGFAPTGSIVRLGGGFIGILRKFKVHSWAKLEDDMLFSYRETVDCLFHPGTINSAIATCDQCDIEQPMVTHDRWDWDFRYECESVCPEKTYGQDCHPCHDDCRTCFGET